MEDCFDQCALASSSLKKEACTAHTLGSLFQLDGGKEVLVADGGGQGETCVIARQQGAAVITVPRGRHTQMREGALHATGDVLSFVHVDTLSPRQRGA